MPGKLRESEEYIRFRSSIPLKKLLVDGDDRLVWKLFDAGCKNTKANTFVFLPPVSGSCEIFYKQLLYLSRYGYRAIALDYPAYSVVEDFCRGFQKVIHILGLLQVHAFGCGLGGFLLANFIQTFRYKQLLSSVILCNTFSDSTLVDSAVNWRAFNMMPMWLLRRFALSNLEPVISNTHRYYENDCTHSDALEFVSESTQGLSKMQLVARLTCRHKEMYARFLNRLQTFPITIIHTFDDNPIYDREKEEIYKNFPYAKYADMKTGGRFPFLTQSSEINLHLKIHLRQFEENNN